MAAEMSMKRVVALAMVFLTMSAVACAKTPQHPNFAGTWVFDPAATKVVADEAKVSGLALFMEQFQAEQDAKAFTMKVDLGPYVVTAIYKLDGTVSKNVSPPSTPGQPEIEVLSNATWEGHTLVVTSTSSSPSATGPIEVKSTRKLSLDAQGRLVVERFGTPANMVPTTRSVYKKKQ